MADKKTGKQAASAASKELKGKKSTPTQKKVAASDLSQAPSKKKKGSRSGRRSAGPPRSN